MGHNVLAVVPQNMLKQETECEAVTLNSFFSEYQLIMKQDAKIRPFRI